MQYCGIKCRFILLVYVRINVFPSVQNTYSVFLVLCSVVCKYRILVLYALALEKIEYLMKGHSTADPKWNIKKESRVVSVGGLRGQDKEEIT